MASRGLLDAILGGAEGACKLKSISIEPREEVPSGWFERHAFGIVRRGVLMRQRLESDGRRTAVDAAGPGALVPLRCSRGDDHAAGQAVTRVLLCVYPEPTLDRTESERTLRDLLELTQEALDRLEAIAAARGHASSTEKVRALLAALTDAMPPRPGGLPRDLPFTQRDLGELLHLRPETVCRALGKLERGARSLRRSSPPTLGTRPSAPPRDPRA
jgi:CRP-like cAMP-binding protein